MACRLTLLLSLLLIQAWVAAPADGGDWIERRVVTTRHSSYSTYDIVDSDSGTLVVCWSQWNVDRTQSDVHMVRVDKNLDPVAPVKVLTTTHSAFSPLMAEDATGNLHVLWQDGVSCVLGDTDPHYAVYDASGEPVSTPRRLLSSCGNIGSRVRADIQLGPDGLVHVLLGDLGGLRYFGFDEDGTERFSSLIRHSESIPVAHEPRVVPGGGGTSRIVFKRLSRVEAVLGRIESMRVDQAGAILDGPWVVSPVDDHDYRAVQVVRLANARLAVVFQDRYVAAPGER